MYKQATKGFSLTELLIVIAILAVLASLLQPSLKNAIHTAEKVSCMSNQKQILGALTGYGEDADGDLPRSWLSTQTNPDYWSMVVVDKAWTSSPIPYGLGVLLANDYLPIGGASMLWCPGFEVIPSDSNSSRYTKFFDRMNTGNFGPNGMHEYSWTPYNYTSYRVGPNVFMNMNDEILQNSPLLVTCGGFALKSSGEYANWNMYSGGRPHAEKGISNGFLDGHVKFYSLDWLILSSAGASYTPNLCRSVGPWTWKKDKFDDPNE